MRHTPSGCGTRIIPAYAGSTRAPCAAPSRTPDHPRIRGEHISCSRFVPAIMGSSPHTRGARVGRNGGRPKNGIIPAYAGSTRGSKRGEAEEWDHPRIRGEHLLTCRLILELAGSSPHTRGARRRRANPTSGMRDHPRIRGEHRLAELREGPRGGSSPHTRGARMDELINGLTGRIIPAYAGSTVDRRHCCSGTWDHPRIRGEHILVTSLQCLLYGSSPHTRGALVAYHQSPKRARIIPAYAGSTRRCW